MASTDYDVLSESSADLLAEHINVLATSGWELVPGQSVTVTGCPIYQNGSLLGIEWLYSVIMRHP